MKSALFKTLDITSLFSMEKRTWKIAFLHIRPKKHVKKYPNIAF